MKDGEFENSDEEAELTDEELSQSGRIFSQESSYAESDSSLFEGHRWNTTGLKEQSNKNYKIAEHATREFWLPFLSKELDEIDPALIVPCGSKATDAVYQLYENKTAEDGEDIGQKMGDEMYVYGITDIEKTYIHTPGHIPDILPSQHWGRGQMDASGLADEIRCESNLV